MSSFAAAASRFAAESMALRVADWSLSVTMSRASKPCSSTRSSRIAAVSFTAPARFGQSRSGAGAWIVASRDAV
jgi:hypothetical protein